MSLPSVTRMKPSMRPPFTSFWPATGPCAPPESSAPFGSRNGFTQRPTPFGTHTVGTPCFIGIPSARGYVPKKESKERFSSMITITCRISWMSPVRRVCRTPATLLRGAEPPHPAAPTATRSRARGPASLS